MFVRIVKLSIAEDNIDTFLETFEAIKLKVRHFEGCQFLELYRDKRNTNQFFTYSYWNTEEDLENYRHSETFKGIWAQLKALFDGKPEAWSVDKLETLN